MEYIGNVDKSQFFKNSKNAKCMAATTSIFPNIKSFQVIINWHIIDVVKHDCLYFKKIRLSLGNHKF